MAHLRDLDKHVFFQLVQPPKATIATAIIPATYINVADYEYFAFLISVGAGFDRTTYTVQVVQATAAAGTGSKNVTGALSVTPTAANKMEMVQCKVSSLDVTNKFYFVSASFTAAGGTTDVGAILFAAWSGHELPPTQSDLESIVRV